MCFHHNPEITSLWGCKVTMIVIIGLFYTACFQWCPQTVCPKRCNTDNICVTLFHCVFSYVTRRCLFAMFAFVWLFKCFPNWLLQRLNSLQLFEVSVTLQHIWCAQLSLFDLHLALWWESERSFFASISTSYFCWIFSTKNVVNDISENMMKSYRISFW